MPLGEPGELGTEVATGCEFSPDADCELCAGADWEVFASADSGFCAGRNAGHAASPTTYRKMQQTDQTRACARFLVSFGLERISQAFRSPTSDVMLCRVAWLVTRTRPNRYVVFGFACKTIAPTIPCIHNRVQGRVGRGANAVGPAGLFPDPSQEAFISAAGSNFDFRLSRYDRRI